MKAIGGYFELELNNNENEMFHSSFYAVNSCRNAMLLLLKNKKYDKVFISHYTCSVMINTLRNNNINIEYYKLDKKLEIKNISINNNDVILYTNYFGLKDSYIGKLTSKYKNIIIDNAQAFFSKPINEMDTIYSPRKFFGIPDGGFLFTSADLELNEYDLDASYDRCSHLLKRADLGAEFGYEDFVLNDAKLDNLPIRRMSRLTKSILSCINLNVVIKTRMANFKIIHENLINKNELKIDFDTNGVPMVYPFLFKDGKKLKNYLIENRIYVATYWPEIIKTVDSKSFEANLVKNLVAIPIDQRYGHEDMKIILDKINDYV